MMFTSHPVFRIAFNARQMCGVLVVLAVASMQCGCQRAVRRFAGNAAGGVVDRVIAQPNSTVELLEAELRWMEDNLYQLDDELDTVLLQLDSARRDNEVLRQELANARGEKPVVDSTSSPTFDYSEEIDLSPPVVVDQKSVLRSNSGIVNEPDSYNSEPDNNLSPSINYGTPTLAPSASQLNRSSEPTPANGGEINAANESNPLQNADGDSPEDGPGDIQPEPADADSDDEDSSVETGVRLEAMPEPKFLPPSEPIEIPKPDPFESRFKSYKNELRSVHRIKLNPKLTGGYNFDDLPGHEGVMVVIEPQTKDSQYVPVTGVVTVEVHDPTKPGLAGRVGKWKFDPIEARKHLKKTAFGKGVHLELPWPNAPPENRELQVTVHLQLADGRTLNAKKQILIEPQTSVLMSKANTTGNGPWSPNRPVPSGTSTSQGGYPAASRSSGTRWLPNR